MALLSVKPLFARNDDNQWEDIMSHLEMTQQQISSTCSEDESFGDDPAAADTETNDDQVGM